MRYFGNPLFHRSSIVNYPQFQYSKYNTEHINKKVYKITYPLTGKTIDDAILFGRKFYVTKKNIQ